MDAASCEVLTLPSDLSDDHLRSLLLHFFQNSYDAIVITDANIDRHKIIYANPSFCKMTGYTLEELRGQKPSILRGPKTSEEVISRLKQNLANGEPFRGATMNYRKNGSPYPVEWNIQPVFDDSGKMIYFLSIQRDLTTLMESLSRLKSTNHNFRKFLRDLTSKGKDTAEELNMDISRLQQDITEELIENEMLFTPALRSDDAVDLYGENEFYYFESGDKGVLPDVTEKPTLSADEYARQCSIDQADLQNMRSIIEDTLSALEILEFSGLSEDEYVCLTNDLQELANTIFYIEEFVDISAILSELAGTMKPLSPQILPEFSIELLSALMKDLLTWVDNVFFQKSAKDIHELDASIITSAKQLMYYFDMAEKS